LGSTTDRTPASADGGGHLIVAGAVITRVRGYAAAPAVDEGGQAMRCPYCRHADSRVVDSREADDGQLIRRRRSCPECGKRFTTVEEAVLAVVKRSGVTEPFSRTKIVGGVRKACQGRPVDEDSIALLAQRVEETVRAKGAAEIPSHEVGLAILGPLRDLDEVAYMRFASVYRSFDSLADFEREIESLRAAARAREGAGAEAVEAAGRTS
jgi:transcriptional repressor NrdR